MFVDFNKELRGHELIFTSESSDDILKITNCFNCGKIVRDLPCFMCEEQGRLIHYDCEHKKDEDVEDLSGVKRNYYHWKCRDLKNPEHQHFKIIQIKQQEVTK